MDQNSAVQIAQQNREQFNVAPNFSVTAAERRVIEITQGPNTAPGPVRDVLVWVVRFAFKSFWVELAVDDARGVIVRREQSR